MQLTCIYLYEHFSTFAVRLIIMAEQNSNKEKVNYFDFSEVLTYFFRKKDPNRPKSFNLKAMHTINKISILMFLGAVIVMIVRAISRA